MIEDNTFVINGVSPLVPIPKLSVGRIIYRRLLINCTTNEAVIDATTGHTLPYKELQSKTCSLAESLRRSGYGPTSTFAICSENCIEFFTPIIAALYIGAAVAPINHNYTASEIVHSLKISKPQVIFCSKQVLPKFIELKRKFDCIERIILINSDVDGFKCVDSFIAEILPNNGPSYKFDVADVQTDHVAFIMCSSGTTGLPKGVMVTHKNVAARLMHMNDPRMTVKSNNCLFLFLPLFHAYGLFFGLGSIYHGTRIVVLTKFDENIFLKTIETHKISTLALVPPLAVFLAKSPLVDKYDLSSLVTVGCGAAPLHKEIEDRLRKRLKIQDIRQGYGMTETTLGVMGVPAGVQKPGSSGKLFPYMSCKIRNPKTGKSLGPNQVGELCVKGALVMKGYCGDPELTKNAFTSDGWLLTGDLGYYDQDEYFYITGRLKELIKYKGFQVAPAELEAILLTNPNIKDAAVVGLPDEEAGELPLAFVVKNPSANLAEIDVQKFVADQVSSHKKLRGGVLFISEIPKNPSGKILRRKLQELLQTQYKSKL